MRESRERMASSEASTPLQIAVVGAGKIGSTFAFQLARAGGHDVTAVARPGSPRLAQLHRDGGIITKKGEHAAVRVLDALDESVAYDLVIVTLLSHQVDAVLPALKRSRAKCVQFMFNVFDPDRLAAAIGAERCAFGMPFIQALLDGDGRLEPTIGAGGQKSLMDQQRWVDMFTQAGIPAALEPDMPLWLRCHSPLCIAFESVSVLGERRGGGASWTEARVLARGVKACFHLIENQGFPIYPRSKRMMDRSPASGLAAIFWGVSRIRSFRVLLATGEAECRSLVDDMARAARSRNRPDLAVKIEAMKPVSHQGQLHCPEAVPERLVSGVARMSDPKTDVHIHFLPSFYREALIAAGEGQPDGISKLPDWSEVDMLATMERLGITRAYLSVSSPGVHFGDDAAACKLARQMNEEAARLKLAHPDRLDFFLVTPLPDVTGALDEIAYAFDHLGAAGVVFETNFKGCYLGDEKLDPVYAALNERHAILFLHPTTPGHPCGCSDLKHLTLGYPAPMIEFLFDTTRTVTNMVLSGVLDRYPNIRVIVPHAGAALPILAGRIDLVGPLLSPAGSAPPTSMRDALRKLHFDVAGAPVPELLQSLLSVADPERIHYGSDWPFTPADACEKLGVALDETPLLSADLRKKVMHGNAEKLFRPK